MEIELRSHSRLSSPTPLSSQDPHTSRGLVLLNDIMGSVGQVQSY